MGPGRTAALLFLTVAAATLLSCGRGHGRYQGYSYGSMVNRVGYALGPLYTRDQLAAQNDMRQTLLSEPWVAVDADGNPIDGTSLIFTPLANRYRFRLELPDFDYRSVDVGYIGEIHLLHTFDDGSLRGTVLLPDVCSGSKIWIGALQSRDKIGTVLPVNFYGACRLHHAWAGPTRTSWEFQSESQVASRLDQATPTPTE